MLLALFLIQVRVVVTKTNFATDYFERKKQFIHNVELFTYCLATSLLLASCNTFPLFSLSTPTDCPSYNDLFYSQRGKV